VVLEDAGAGFSCRARAHRPRDRARTAALILANPGRPTPHGERSVARVLNDKHCVTASRRNKSPLKY
jgi:hypothetical protein